MGDAIEVLAIVFFTGAFWQRTGTLNETMKEMKSSFDKSIGALTERVNEHGTRIGRIEGRME
jgi:predicted transposase YdaD